MVRLTVDIMARGTSGYTKKKRDESVQQYLKRLTHLYLENRGIDEVGDDLSVCRSLTVLYMYDNQLLRIPNLNGNCNVTHLYLQNNQIDKLHGLNGLHKLIKLYMGGNCITVVEGLDKLSQLEELHLENQRLSVGEKLLFDPRTLVALMQGLQVLNISGNNVDKLRDLQCLSKITQFMAMDNNLSDMKDVSSVLSAWPRLYRLDLLGNPICHKAKFRDRIIIMVPTLDILDGKEITETAKKFLMNWKASREMLKRKHTQSSLHQGFTNATGDADDGHRATFYSQSSSQNLGNDHPGYIMPALPRKQFQDVLAKSASQSRSGLDRQEGYSYSDSGLKSSGPRSNNSASRFPGDGLRLQTTDINQMAHIPLGSGSVGDGI